MLSIASPMNDAALYAGIMTDTLGITLLPS